MKFNILLFTSDQPFYYTKLKSQMAHVLFSHYISHSIIHYRIEKFDHQAFVCMTAATKLLNNFKVQKLTQAIHFTTEQVSHFYFNPVNIAKLLPLKQLIQVWFSDIRASMHVHIGTRSLHLK